MKKVFFLIIMFLCLFSCDKPKIEDSSLLVNFKEDSIILKLTDKAEYQLEYFVSEGSETKISCDKTDGYTLSNNIVSFTDKGEYTFKITAKKGDKEATDTMVIYVLGENEPYFSDYLETVDFDISTGNFEPEFSLSPSIANVTISCDKEIELIDNKVKFPTYGDYKLEITGSVGEYSSSIEITVNAYNLLKLNGMGTINDPWQVKTVSDLELIKETIEEEKLNLKDKYFKQMNDLNLEGLNWTPIGTIGLPFEGIYDGNNYSINNLSINTSESFQGFFGFVTGIVSNLTVEGDILVTTENLPYSHSLAGGIAGAMNNGAKIINCTNYVNITADSSAGGIVGEIQETDFYLYGEVYSEVINCKNYGKITAKYNAVNENTMYFGGITGKNHGKISGCVNYAEVDAYTNKNDSTTGNDYVGGIAGYSFQPFYSGFGPNSSMDYAAIENSRNEGKVSGLHAVGGIVGQHVLRIVNCENLGAIKGDKSIGGIAGISGTNNTMHIGYTSINKCKNSGAVTSTNDYAGGIAGYVYNDVTECENSGNISSNGTEAKSIGGISGLAKGLTDNCKNSGEITGLCYIAGIVGNAQGGVVSNCINEGNIIATATSNAVSGGIVGDNENNKIENCINSGNVKGISTIGGIVGRLKGNGYKVENCKSLADATVEGDNCLGGIAGRIEATSSSSPIEIIDCENSSRIIGTTGYVGGIVGMHGSHNIVSSCTNNGKVSAKGYNSLERIGVGGISGQLFNSSKVRNCINNGEVEGERVTGGIVGNAKPSSSYPFEITDCKNNGSVICNYKANSDAWVGGILGYGTNGSLTNVENLGEIINTNGSKYVNSIYGKISNVTLNTTGGEGNA